jgi:hypothetical protein
VAVYPNAIIGESAPSSDGQGWDYGQYSQQERNEIVLAGRAVNVVQFLIESGFAKVWVGGCCATTQGYFGRLRRGLAEQGLIADFRKAEEYHTSQVAASSPERRAVTPTAAYSATR